MITIKNEFLTAKFNTVGAELKSLSYNDQEYIWQGDPKFWNNSAPILFPICSCLKGDTYYYKNKAYKMQKHGYVSSKTFEVVEISENKVTFLHKSDDETFKVFPFEYELFVIYELVDKKLNITYKVNNLTDGDMYFSIGAHEGFICEGGVEDYEILFPKNVTLKAMELENFVDALSDDTVTILENDNCLSLDYKYFSIDALIFKNIDFSEVVLKNRKNGKMIKSSFEGFPYLLFWTKKDAPLLCIEPWCGITDNINSNQDITVKEGIEHLEKGETFTRIRTIEII